MTTLGLDSVHSKYEDSERKTSIPVILWDTAGQERFRTIPYSFYKKANAVLLVYDVTNRETFTDLKVWMTSIRAHAVENIKMVLVANKVDDLEGREVSRFEGQNTARENSMMYFEVSAKDNQGVKECVDFTIKEVYDDIIKRMSISPLDKTRDPSIPLDPSRHSSITSRKQKRRCTCLRFFEGTDASQ